MKQQRPVPHLPLFARSFTGITNFNPDQISVIAHIFMSTNPASRPQPRTRFSVRSVATPELFFGQAIQSIPAGAKQFAAAATRIASPVCDFANRKTKSRSLAEGFSVRHFLNSSLSSVFTSAATSISAMRKPSFIPNFFASGVPEYPGIRQKLRPSYWRKPRNPSRSHRLKSEKTRFAYGFGA
jgi:hypothetical protein